MKPNNIAAQKARLYGIRLDAEDNRFVHFTHMLVSPIVAPVVREKVVEIVVWPPEISTQDQLDCNLKPCKSSQPVHARDQ